MNDDSINGGRLLKRIFDLGSVGRDAEGLTRLAASDTDKLGRDLLVRWLQEAGLEVAVDRIGNIFGVWQPAQTQHTAPVMVGSHIDTVINAGMYDGCYGVLAGLEVIQSLKEQRFEPARPIVVAAFTNEEGVRFAPDMMGSLVYAGGLAINEALATIGTDGAVLADELRRIGYVGDKAPGYMKPHAYVELHIEQGPILEREGRAIGAVENLQGISWRKIIIDGTANHAGTTPISMRADAGYGAARITSYLRERARTSATQTVATVGRLALEPNAINVIPSRATLTVDLRDPFEHRLHEEEVALDDFLKRLAEEEDLKISVETLARSNPVSFSQDIVALVEAGAGKRGLSCRRMTSGAGHDAQMIAAVAPTAMIFVPSAGGISHNPAEHSSQADLIAGANVLLDVVCAIARS